MKIATGEIDEPRAPRPRRKLGRTIRRSGKKPEQEPQETMLASSRPPHFVTVSTLTK
jgi:hypothetical protein